MSLPSTLTFLYPFELVLQVESVNSWDILRAWTDIDDIQQLVGGKAGTPGNAIYMRLDLAKGFRHYDFFLNKDAVRLSLLH